jgi:hypothetical protein
VRDTSTMAPQLFNDCKICAKPTDFYFPAAQSETDENGAIRHER